MSTPLDRIREACDKAEAARKVGRDPGPDTHYYAAVRAGDVAEATAGSDDAAARALAKGVAGLAPETVVYQRADQLRAVVDLTVVPAPQPAPAPEVFEAPAPAPAEPVAPETRRKFNPSGK